MSHELIPTLTRSTPEFRRELEVDIVSTWRRTTDDQRRRGTDWYYAAHELAFMLSGGDVARGAGVIAALSANKAWDINQRLAARAFTGDASGHVGDALGKVRTLEPRIPQRGGADRHPAECASGHRVGVLDRDARWHEPTPDA